MTPPNAETWLQRNWGHCAAALLAVAAFLPAVGGEPIWDDAIVFDRYLPAFRSAGDAFFPPPGTGELGELYYRPLVTVSYLWDDALFGRERFVGHHLTTILFHVLAVLGVGLLARRLLPEGPASRAGAFAAALCFAVHPVHVDSVAQISGRSDPMAATFLVAALLALLHGRDRPALRWPWVAAAAAFLAALLSKEVAAVGAVLGGLLLWLPRPAPAATWWRCAAAFGGAGVVYLALRAGAGPGAAPLLDLPSGEVAARVLRATGYYVSMLLVPAHQAAFVPIERTPPAWLGAAAALLVLVAGAFAWRGRKERPIVFVAWAWLVLTLAPVMVLLLVKASEQPVAERYLYLPSVAVSLAFGWLVSACVARGIAPRVVATAVALAVAGGTVATALRARIYVDDEAFWSDTVAKAPGAALPLYELGLAQRKAGRLDEARATLQRALELYDDAEGRSLAQNTIGTIHLEREEWDEAELWFRDATATRPGYATPWFNLAMVYAMRAETRRGPGNAPDPTDLERCVAALDQAITQRPGYDKARFRLAATALTLTKVYLVHGRRDDAAGMRDRARVAAEWLVRNLPGTQYARQGQAILQELGRLPR